MSIDFSTIEDDQLSAVHDLEGKTLTTGWQITKKVKSKPGSTGSNFSVCYLAKRKNEIGFLKAINVLAFLNDEDVDLPTAMAETLNTFNFERDILEKCKEKGLSKVSKLLDYGSENIKGYLIKNVHYLVFEKADSDVREFINFSSQIDFAWKLRSLHNIAVGIKQLHSIEISHQDIKPSNIFVFNKELSKIGDLGRALSESIFGPHSDRNFAGDGRYAPPEVFHRFVLPEWKDKVFAIDCYLLGSMAAYYITGHSMTALLSKYVNPNISILTLSFQQALPYWINAFDDVLDILRQEVKRLNFTDTDLLIETIQMLSYPDPIKRGHIKNIKGIGNNFNMERFVEIFNRLARRAEYQINN